MKVRIKTWNKMKDEFGLNNDNEIMCKLIFPEYLEKVIPESRIIDIVPDTEDENGEYRWYANYMSSWQISTDMIEVFLDEVEEVLVTFEDGDYPMIIRTNIPIDKVEDIYFMYENDGLDVAMKFDRFAKENGYYFEEVEFTKVTI